MKVKKHIICILLMTMFAISFMLTTTKAVNVKITADTLNLREKASTNANILTIISKGEKCELLKEEGNWYQIRYKTYTGYISKEYASKEETDTGVDKEPSEDEPVDTQKDTNQGITTGKLSEKTSLRILPLIHSNSIANLTKGTTVTLVSEVNGWYYIQTDSAAGWIRSNFITGKEEGNSSNKIDTNDQNKNDGNASKNNDKTASFTEKVMYVNDSYVNLRKEANTTSSILMVVSLNTKLTVIGEEADWYKVKTSAGNAYVSKELLSDKETSTTSRGSIVRGSIDNLLKNEIQDKNENVTQTSSTKVSTTKGEEIVSYAKQFLGIPYVYGGASKSGFDCSGFTMYVYQKFGISMRHGAQAQAKLGTAVKADKSSASSLKNNLKLGDLVFFLDYETMDEIGHCGIYVGNGNFIHASSGSGYCVKINSLLPGEYYNSRYCEARRII